MKKLLVGAVLLGVMGMEGAASRGLSYEQWKRKNEDFSVIPPSIKQGPQVTFVQAANPNDAIQTQKEPVEQKNQVKGHIAIDLGQPEKVKENTQSTILTPGHKVGIFCATTVLLMWVQYTAAMSSIS